MHGQDLTKGPIGKQLWSLAWPMMLSMFFHTLYNLVDAFWVAKISPAAIAAVSISQIVLFVMITLAMGLSVGSSVLMGMSLGAHDKTEAERVVGQGYILSCIAAVLFTVVALLFREPFLKISGALEDIFPLALSYFTVVTSGSVVMFLMMNTSTVFNAQGDNFTPTKLFALSTFVNIVLDPLLIFGYGPFPELGIAGAAYATLVAQVVFLVLALRYLMGDKMMVRLNRKNMSLRWKSVKSVFRIGIPASLTQTLNPLSFLVIMALVSAVFAEAGAAAFSIGFRIEFFAFIPAIGFGFAAMAMMGQNIGAQKFERLRNIITRSVLYGAGAALGFSIAVFAATSWIIGVFTEDPLVTEYATLYFRIVPLGYVFFAAAFIETSLFQGLGRSWPGFWITFLRIAVITALAYAGVYTFELPIWSVWGSFVAGGIAASLVGFAWILYALKREMNTKKTPVCN